jgi:hypothetical protein
MIEYFSNIPNIGLLKDISIKHDIKIWLVEILIFVLKKIYEK